MLEKATFVWTLHNGNVKGPETTLRRWQCINNRFNQILYLDVFLAVHHELTIH